MHLLEYDAIIWGYWEYDTKIQYVHLLEYGAIIWGCQEYDTRIHLGILVENMKIHQETAVHFCTAFAENIG